MPGFHFYKNGTADGTDGTQISEAGIGNSRIDCGTVIIGQESDPIILAMRCLTGKQSSKAPILLADPRLNYSVDGITWSGYGVALTWAQVVRDKNQLVRIRYKPFSTDALQYDVNGNVIPIRFSIYVDYGILVDIPAAPALSADVISATAGYNNIMVSLTTPAVSNVGATILRDIYDSNGNLLAGNVAGTDFPKSISALPAGVYSVYVIAKDVTNSLTSTSNTIPNLNVTDSPATNNPPTITNLRTSNAFYGGGGNQVLVYGNISDTENESITQVELATATSGTADTATSKITLTNSADIQKFLTTGYKWSGAFNATGSWILWARISDASGASGWIQAAPYINVLGVSTVNGQPSAPVITATIDRNGNMSVNMTADTNTAGVEYYDIIVDNVTVKSCPAGTTYWPQSLGTTYSDYGNHNVRLEARFTGGYTSTSNLVTVARPVEALPTITGLTVSGVSRTGFTVKGTASDSDGEPITGIDIVWSTNGSLDQAGIASLVGTSTSTTTDVTTFNGTSGKVVSTTLTLGTTYYIYVRANDASGNGNFVGYYTQTPSDSLPTITSISGSATSATAVSISGGYADPDGENVTQVDWFIDTSSTLVGDLSTNYNNATNKGSITGADINTSAKTFSKPVTLGTALVKETNEYIYARAIDASGTGTAWTKSSAFQWSNRTNLNVAISPVNDGTVIDNLVASVNNLNVGNGISVPGDGTLTVDTSQSYSHYQGALWRGNTVQPSTYTTEIEFVAQQFTPDGSGTPVRQANLCLMDNISGYIPVVDTSAGSTAYTAHRKLAFTLYNSGTNNNYQIIRFNPSTGNAEWFNPTSGLWDGTSAGYTPVGAVWGNKHKLAIQRDANNYTVTLTDLDRNVVIMSVTFAISATRNGSSSDWVIGGDILADPTTGKESYMWQKSIFSRISGVGSRA